MRKFGRRAGMLFGLVVLIGSPLIARGAETATGVLDLLSIGKPGPSAIVINASMGRKPAAHFSEGESITLSLETSREAHVIILGLLSNGDLLVGFPNPEPPRSLIQPGKRYAIPDNRHQAGLVVGQRIQGAKFAVYVSGEPFPEPPDTILQDDWSIIARTAQEQIKALRQVLLAAATNPTFNRLDLEVKDSAGESLGVHLKTAPPKPRRVYKKLPDTTGDSGPESTTGTQGVKQLPTDITGDDPETTGGAQGVKGP